VTPEGPVPTSCNEAGALMMDVRLPGLARLTLVVASTWITFETEYTPAELIPKSIQ